MLRIDWLFVLVFLPFASCSVAIVGSAGHCVYTGKPEQCPQIWSHGKCVTGTLGCPHLAEGTKE